LLLIGRFITLGISQNSKMVATFGSKGSPTRQEFIYELLFFVDLPKTLVALRSTMMGVVKGAVATFPFPKRFFLKRCNQVFSS
jgi:hypothetical protein